MMADQQHVSARLTIECSEILQGSCDEAIASAVNKVRSAKALIHVQVGDNYSLEIPVSLSEIPEEIWQGNLDKTIEQANREEHFSAERLDALKVTIERKNQEIDEDAKRKSLRLQEKTEEKKRKFAALAHQKEERLKLKKQDWVEKKQTLAKLKASSALEPMPVIAQPIADIAEPPAESPYPSSIEEEDTSSQSSRKRTKKSAEYSDSSGDYSDDDDEEFSESDEASFIKGDSEGLSSSEDASEEENTPKRPKRDSGGASHRPARNRKQPARFHPNQPDDNSQPVDLDQNGKGFHIIKLMREPFFEMIRLTQAELTGTAEQLLEVWNTGRFFVLARSNFLNRAWQCGSQSPSEVFDRAALDELISNTGNEGYTIPTIHLLDETRRGKCWACRRDRVQTRVYRRYPNNLRSDKKLGSCCASKVGEVLGFAKCMQTMICKMRENEEFSHYNALTCWMAFKMCLQSTESTMEKYYKKYSNER